MNDYKRGIRDTLLTIGLFVSSLSILAIWILR